MPDRPSMESAHPFREEPVEFERGIAKLEQAKKIIRPNIESNPYSDAFTMEDYKEGKAELQRFSENYGIAIPNFDYVVGGSKRESGDLNMYTVIDEVKGRPLQELRAADFPDKEKAAQIFDEYFTGVAAYYIDSVHNKKRFINDLVKLEQYVYGTKPGDSKPQIYLVDVDPYFSHKDPVDREVEALYDLNELRKNAVLISKHLGISLENFWIEISEFWKGYQMDRSKDYKGVELNISEWKDAGLQQPEIKRKAA